MPLGLKLNELITSTGNGIVDAIILFLVSSAVILLASAYVYHAKVMPLVRSLKGDTAVIREHTENNHTNAPNPNLRDDLDAKHSEITSQLCKITVTLEDLDHSSKRVDSELARVHEELGSLRSDVSVERGRINKMMER